MERQAGWSDEVGRIVAGRITVDAAQECRARRWIALLVVALGLIGGLTACEPDPPRSAGLLYGDSLSVQAKDYLIYLYGSGHVGKRLQVQAQGGSALCDWVNKAVADIPAVKPSFVALEFFGNNLTPCMGSPGNSVPGHPIGSSAFLDIYGRSMDEVAAAARAAKVPVYWVVGPPRHADDDDPGLNATLAAMAKARGMRIVDGSAAVSDPAGGWTETMPCASTERAADGCRSGRIAVRAPDHVHFLANTASYNAGALRWAGATVALLP